MNGIDATSGRDGVMGRSGYTRLARSALLGRRPRERWSYVALMATILCGVAFIDAVLPGPGPDFAFVYVALAIALVSSGQVTSTALRAQQLFTGTAAPSGAVSHWRRGWLQGQAMLCAVLVGIVLAEATWRGAWQGDRLLLIGAIVASQALAVCIAFSLNGRSLRLRFMAIAIVLSIGIGYACVHGVVPMPSPDIGGSALILVGIAGLLIAATRLGPGSRIASRPVAHRSLATPIVRLMQRWTPLSGTRGRRWWGVWVSATGNMVLVFSQSAAGIWASTSPWTRASLILWFTCMVSATLSAQGLHWRIWLQPGGPRRSRLGRHFFFSTLQVYALILVPLTAVVSALAWSVGATPRQIADYLLNNGHFFIELVFSIALAVLIVGLFFGRWSRRALGVAMGGMAFAAIAVLNVAWRGGRHAVDHATLASSAGYDLGLVILAVVCIALADRAWSHRNIDPLFRVAYELGQAR